MCLLPPPLQVNWLEAAYDPHPMKPPPSILAAVSLFSAFITRDPAVMRQVVASAYNATKLPNLRALQLDTRFRRQHCIEDGSSPQLGAWSDLQMLTVRGYFVPFDGAEYELIRSLLHRAAPSLSTLHLLLGFDSLSPLPHDLNEIIPEMNHLRSLAISNVPVRFLTAILDKAPRLRSLQFEGRMKHDNESMNSSAKRVPGVSGEEAPNWVTLPQLERAIRASDALSPPTPSRAAAIYIKHLTLTPIGEAGTPDEIRRIATGAELVIGLSAFARVTHLALDRSLFTVFIARGVVMPAHIVSLQIVYTEWDRQVPEPDIFGEELARREQVFKKLGAQLMEGLYRNLRTVAVIYWTHEGRPLVINQQSSDWLVFKRLCESRRITLTVQSVRNFGLSFE
ncbi:hypothetical protein BKA62DRAFT_699223 [Auriculariales sp. MPI-PUGE-AT-0066]|nr:hypothetical protein BKA62DRAFT_699223 [Auriculariales sp. MPI-PUGE-AT-0066]